MERDLEPENLLNSSKEEGEGRRVEINVRRCDKKNDGFVFTLYSLFCSYLNFYLFTIYQDLNSTHLNIELIFYCQTIIRYQRGYSDTESTIPAQFYQATLVK